MARQQRPPRQHRPFVLAVTTTTLFTIFSSMAASGIRRQPALSNLFRGIVSFASSRSDGENMWPFSQPNQNTEVITPATPFAVDRLAAVEVAYRESERVWNDAFWKLRDYKHAHPENEPISLAGKIILPINRANVERDRLTYEEFLARTKRNELLQERAALRKSAGLSR